MRSLERYLRRTGALPTLALLAQALLAACSPRYDWREQRPPNAGWGASFPARVQSATRSFRIDGVDFTMTIYAAQIDAATFAIGVAEFPTNRAADNSAVASGEVSHGASAESTASGISDPAAEARNASVALRAGLLRNIGGSVVHEAPATMLRSEKNLSPIEASALEATGKVAGERVRLAARFAVLPDANPAASPATVRRRIVQVFILGPEGQLNSAAGREAIDTFMTSVRLD